MADPFIHAEAMESPQRNYWKQSIEEDSMAILLNNTLTGLKCWEAHQLQVMPIGSQWV